MKFNTQYDYVSPGGEINSLVSETVPGMAYKMTELLSMYTKPEVLKNLPYIEDEIIRPADLTDIAEIHNQLTDIENNIGLKKSNEKNKSNDKSEDESGKSDEGTNT